MNNNNPEKKIRKFDTKIQYHKYKVLREVAKEAWQDTLLENAIDLPERIVPGKKPTMRCCIYKERAVLKERVKIAMGGRKKNSNIIEVIDIACDECPMGGYEVTISCRGCMAHRCEDACRFNAITFDDNHVAHIDKSKCVECGACSKVCPFNAISDHKRPCKNACKVNAISITDDYTACIDYSKCISCGACVYQCPFGAIMDKSFIVETVDILKEAKKNPEMKVYALVAPSLASQFTYAKLGQVLQGIKELGFTGIVEAALGADMVAYDEAKELVEKDFLTSSCCPAFVDYIEKQFPSLKDKISTNLSPAAKIAKYIKDTTENSKIVFIGPCTAKKMEYNKPELKKYIDSVITFEELQALFDSIEIDITTLEEDTLNNASYFGRIFARSGGLTDAIRQALKEQGENDFELNSLACDGIEECRIALLKANKNLLKANFIEGMACVGGCIGGAGCLTHGNKSKIDVDRYGKNAHAQTITEAITDLNF